MCRYPDTYLAGWIQLHGIRGYKFSQAHSPVLIHVPLGDPLTHLHITATTATGTATTATGTATTATATAAIASDTAIDTAVDVMTYPTVTEQATTTTAVIIIVIVVL